MLDYLYELSRSSVFFIHSDFFLISSFLIFFSSLISCLDLLTKPSSFLEPTEGKDWLKVGQNAELTVFRVDEANISVEDSLGDHLTLTQLIHPLLAVQGSNHAECNLRFQ